MQWRQQYFGFYTLAWGVALLILGLVAWNFLFWAPAPARFSEIDSRDVKLLSSDTPQLPAQSIDERTSDLAVTVEGMELTLSSSDGKLKLHLWAKSAVKEGMHYWIDHGSLMFAMENRDTLQVQISDAQYSQEADRACIEGTLIGRIVESGQYFEAQDLCWDQRTSIVTVGKVVFANQLMRVMGSQMQLDLATRELIFKGPVEAGI